MTDITELVCQWVEDDIDGDVWKSECDNYFVFNAGAPLDNGFKYCPYCGKTLCEVDTHTENGE